MALTTDELKQTNAKLDWDKLNSRLRDWLMDKPGKCAPVDDAAVAMDVLPIYIRFAGTVDSPWLTLDVIGGVEHICVDQDD